MQTVDSAARAARPARATARRHAALRSLALVLGMTAAGWPALAAAAPLPTDPSALARAVATAYENEERGVVAFDVKQSTAIRGGFFHRDDEDLTAFVEVDGKLSHKVVLRHVEGGKADDAAGLAKRATGPEAPLGRFGLRLPCDPAAQADYSFDAPRAQPGGLVLPFHARVRDQAHGDGEIVFDPGAAHIVSIALVPAVLPDRATAASLQLSFGPLTSARYGITRIVRTFDGRVGPLRGRATSTSTYVNVRPFASAAAAAEAIDRER